MQICTSLQKDNHASTQLLSFFTGRMPFLPPNQQHPIWPKMGALGAKYRKGGAILITNERVFTFEVFYVSANFGENRSRHKT